MILQTKDAGVIEKALEAVTDLQQHYETQVLMYWKYYEM